MKQIEQNVAKIQKQPLLIVRGMKSVYGAEESCKWNSTVSENEYTMFTRNKN